MVDEENRVTGWKGSSIVHMFNKHELDHPELSRIRAERSHTILAGDSLHDYNMAEGTDTVMRVRILDTDTDQEAAHEDTFEVFDTIIEDGTLNPLIDLIKQIIE
jgi:hypothetical protein